MSPAPVSAPDRRQAARAALLALTSLGIALGGCTLVDQRTFDPRAGTPPEVPKPPTAVATAQPDRGLDGAPPFLTVRVGQDTGYDSAIAQAVTAALARKRDARFIVLTAVPPGTDAAEAAAVAETAPEAERVALLIERRGVQAARVQLQARAEPNLAGREVRVYVR